MFEYHGKVIDAHLHYGADPAIAEQLIMSEMAYDNPDSVIKALDKYNIQQCLLLTPDRILNPPRDVDYKEANEIVARAVEKYPKRIVGAMRLNPLFGEEFIWENIRYYSEEKGFRAIKMLARVDFYNPASLKVMAPVYEAAGKYNMTILFHSGHPSRDLPSLQAYGAKHYPDVKLVIAHMGLHDYLNETIIACKEIPNVYADMSQAWPYDIKAFVHTIGAERLLFGTDGPFQSPRVERLKVEECDLTDSQLEMIFHKNAERIYGFSPD
ncbi:MAG: amidohydrolase family protein [Chloroflexi bacterium]|nr:amidohydrolase family protein [Chloroflexota bacterium]